MNRTSTRGAVSAGPAVRPLMALIVAAGGAISLAGEGNDAGRARNADFSERIADLVEEWDATWEDLGNEDRSRRVERKFQGLLKDADGNGAELIAEVMRCDRARRERGGDDPALAVAGIIVRLLPFAKDDRTNIVRTALPPREAALLIKRSIERGHEITTRLQRERKDALVVGMESSTRSGTCKGSRSARI